MVEVVTLNEEQSAWSAFVARSEAATLYHDIRWKGVIEKAFGHRCQYLMAIDAASTVRGVLPLGELKSLTFGHFLVSLPFFNYGGILAEDTVASEALAWRAIELAQELGAHHIELRHSQRAHLAWKCRQHKVALRVSLASGAEACWKQLSSRLRGKVRKSLRAGAEFTVDGPDALERFYSVFARNMRDLGTPVYPRSFFTGIAAQFPSEHHLFVVMLRGRAVAAAFGLLHRGTLELPWICSNYDFSTEYVNELLYWSVLEWADRLGCSAVDLGRSTIGAGPHRFKQQWKPEERPLFWYYWLADGARVPNFDPTTYRYAAAVRCWQCMPLPIANLLGPHIIRNIP